MRRLLTAPQDIDEHNIMNNIYSLWEYGPEFAPTLAQHRRTSRVLYCLFDFNLSVQFSLDKPLHECRLIADPSTMSGTPYGPLDVSLGVCDYDPFAYDVACLGNMFRAQLAVSVEFVATCDVSLTSSIFRTSLAAFQSLLHFSTK